MLEANEANPTLSCARTWLKDLSDRKRMTMRAPLIQRRGPQTGPAVFPIAEGTNRAR
jgi:hypothetical protein